MALPIIETQAVNEIAKLLYGFLPGKAHPYADQSISFQGVAGDLKLKEFWPSGSKLPAITTLLERTLEYRRELFCKLILEIVRRSLKYRNSKKNPIRQEEIETLNQLIKKVSFKIPELWDNKFLGSLPSNKKEPVKTIKEKKLDLSKLKNDFLDLDKLNPQERGYAFEKFLNELFKAFDLEPKGSFRLIGEQIDGSFQLDSEVYLVEAKWQKKPSGFDHLSTFKVKVEGKATWTRGLFVSCSGFSEDGIEAFMRCGATSIICLTGQDLFFILDGLVSLKDAIKFKVRNAAETGEIFTSIFEICTF